MRAGSYFTDRSIGAEPCELRGRGRAGAVDQSCLGGRGLLGRASQSLVGTALGVEQSQSRRGGIVSAEQSQSGVAGPFRGRGWLGRRANPESSRLGGRGLFEVKGRANTYQGCGQIYIRAVMGRGRSREDQSQVEPH